MITELILLRWSAVALESRADADHSDARVAIHDVQTVVLLYVATTLQNRLSLE
jgi:hypothetical protein